MVNFVSARFVCPMTAVLLSFVVSTLDPFGALQARPAVGQEEPPVPGAPTPQASNEAEEEPKAVIPAGQEELLAEMVGQGATLPGPCTFAAGEVERTVIKSTYKCPDGQVVFELRHPSTAPVGATYTAKFAIMLQSGSPPAGLVDALVALIRSRETAFEWKWTATASAKRSSSRVLFILLTTAGLLASVGIWRALRRSRKP